MDNSKKTAVTCIISFILGAAAGGTGSFFVCKRYYKAKNDEELKNQTEYYMNKYDILKEDKDDGSGKKEGAEKEPSKEEMQFIKASDVSDVYKSKSPEEMDKVAYGQYFNNDDTGNDISVKKTKKKVTRKNGPKLVTKDIWEANPDNYEKKFLIYYDADDVMIDEESEQVIEDGKELVGADNLDTADQFDNEIFVSNAKTKCIYQVTVEQMSFLETGSNG